MQRFTLLLLVASIALQGAAVPAEANRLVKDETSHAQRFARHLASLAPVKRSRTDTEKRSHVSQRQGSRDYTGTLQVQSENGTLLGSVFNNPEGPNGLNLVSSSQRQTYPNLVVDFKNGNVVAEDPKFNPSFIGAGGELSFLTTNVALIILGLTNVEEGVQAASTSQSDIWTLDLSSMQLNATWTNLDQSQSPLTIVYNTSSNKLSFTDTPGVISDPQILVSLYLVQDQ